MKKPRKSVRCVGMNSEKVELKLDWCSHEAAKFACENWHYSKCMPAGKMVKIGVWENSKYIGCVLFSRGATCEIGSPFGLNQTEICELTRIALTKHKSEVSKIMAFSIKMLKKLSQGLKLIVSYADPEQDHVGGIYQATNWIFIGRTKQDSGIIINGKKHHRRSVGAKYGTCSLDWIIKNVDKNAQRSIDLGKYKYIMPLDNAMRKQVELLRKPYPKKSCVGSSKLEHPPIQEEEGGVVPTSTLHFKGNPNAE